LNSASIAASTQVTVPALFAPDAAAAKRFIEFFTAHIRNPNTRRAYARAAMDFAASCEGQGLRELRHVEPVHVAAHIETLLLRLSKPSVKQHLAGIRMLCDWLVVGQVIPFNPASVVHGPKYSARTGKTQILDKEETRKLFDSIDTATLVGLRDRALIGVMVYTFARIGAVVAMRVEDVLTVGRRLRVRLHEKNGKLHEMPCHHNLEEYLQAYVEAARISEDPKGSLFRSSPGWSGELTENPISQSDAYRMIQRRRRAAGIKTKTGNHSFRGTGITEYLLNGGTLESAQRMANHGDPRTTRLYDRREDRINLDEVERIAI
jgi:site-specific recombinase XerD